MKKTLLLVVFLLASVPAFAQTASDEVNRFVDHYAAEVSRTGFRPDATSTRESRILFLQATLKRFCSPLLAMKRADPGRPISDEVVVFLKTGAEYRVFSDFIVSGGSSSWRLSKHLDGKLEVAQPLVNPITLGVLAEASFAPLADECAAPEPPPVDPPVVTPPAPIVDLSAIIARLDALQAQVAAIQSSATAAHNAAVEARNAVQAWVFPPFPVYTGKVWGQGVTLKPVP